MLNEYLIVSMMSSDCGQIEAMSWTCKPNFKRC